MKVVVTGGSGFLGQALLQENPGWTGLGHAAALRDASILRDADVVINCAFAPELRSNGYSAAQDIDGKIADVIENTDTRYIMLSSRLVYGPAAGRPLREDDTPKPDTPYGINKLRIETQLRDALGHRLTVLRLGNIFGFERGRTSFFGRALSRLERDGIIAFDMSPETKRDFLPLQHFSTAVAKIVAGLKAGVFNLGSGIPTPCGDIAAGLIDGYGGGRLVVTDDNLRDEFTLDMSQAAAAFHLEKITPKTIRQDCIALGRQLKSVTSSAE